MSPTLLPYFISGGGFAGIVVFCIIMKWLVPGWVIKEKDEQIKELKAENKAQAARAEAGVLAGQVVKDVMLGLRQAHEELTQ